MNQFKRILSVLALLCMGGFVVSVLMLLFGNSYEIMGRWIYGFITVFLVFGLSALLINFLQKRAADQKANAEAADAEKQPEEKGTV